MTRKRFTVELKAEAVKQVTPNVTIPFRRSHNPWGGRRIACATPDTNPLVRQVVAAQLLVSEPSI